MGMEADSEDASAEADSKCTDWFKGSFENGRSGSKVEECSDR
jgi:hypothetical protein